MEEFVIGVAGLFFIFIVALGGYAIGADNPSEFGRNTAICEYEGGELKDDVCIKGGKVIDLG